MHMPAMFWIPSAHPTPKETTESCGTSEDHEK